MRIQLVSGQWLVVSHVSLFDQKAVADISALRAEASKVLGGTGMSVGVIGAPGLAFAAEAAALSLISGLIAKGAQSAAVEKLTKAATLHEKLPTYAAFIATTSIPNLYVREPSVWRASVEGRLFVHNGDEFTTLKTDLGDVAVRWRDVSICLTDPDEEQVMQQNLPLRTRQQCRRGETFTPVLARHSEDGIVD